MNKKTVVLGASPNPSRFSYIATTRLESAGHDVLPLGIRKGQIEETEIITDWKEFNDVDTVTMYMNAKHQEAYYDYILNTLDPKRIIFNPGAENPDLAQQARAKGIEVDNACTLVMLSIGNY